MSHKVSTDALETLGTIIDENAGSDAYLFLLFMLEKENILKALPVGAKVYRRYIDQWGTKVENGENGLIVRMQTLPCKGAPDGWYNDEIEYDFLTCEALMLMEKL